MSSSFTGKNGNIPDDPGRNNEPDNNDTTGAEENAPVTAAGHWIPQNSTNPAVPDSGSDSGMRWTGEVTWVVPSVPGMDRPAPLRVKVDTGQIRRRLSRIDTAEGRGEFWADYWLEVLEAVAEIPALLDAVEQLVSAWKGERRRYADLLAAAKATLSANADGEKDPLSYLRDELGYEDPDPTTPAEAEETAGPTWREYWSDTQERDGSEDPSDPAETSGMSWVDYWSDTHFSAPFSDDSSGDESGDESGGGR